ncbi:MAG: uracil-DNA glycosylase [Mycoplasmatales bacterium]
MININDWELQVDDKFLDKIKEKYNNNNIAPAYEDIFKVFKLIKFQDVKVIILGQDPYPTQGDANGIAFSVNRQDKLPPSLKNIYKELEKDLGVVRTSGNLEDLVRQGVLLLNTVLTVEVGNAKSHAKIGWQKVTDEVIKQLNDCGEKVFVLLGNDAQKYEKHLTNSTNIILKTSHPSPLAVYRGFSGSRIFSQINASLKKLNKTKINWEEKN